MTTSSASSSRSLARFGRPRVAFLLEELGRSGGAQVVYRYARHLAEAEGFACELLVTHPKAPLQAEGIDPDVPVRRLGKARGEHFDIAVATWWTTAEALFELDAGRRTLFVQSLEQRFYGDAALADRLGAAAALDLPVDFIVVSAHMRRLLEELRPGARCELVPHGIDKAAFAPRERPPRDGPLRVLVEGQPTLWFKAVGEAVTAARAMAEPSRVTVCVHDPDGAGELGADRVVGGLDPAGMASLYAEHDVLLKLSRFEGFGLPPLEAFHVGTPCIVTPFSGQEDFVDHGANGLVVGFDDPAATGAALDLLARDCGVLERLGAGALATAGRWPSVEGAARRFAGALRAFMAEPGPAPAAALRRLTRGRRLATELVREQLSQAEWYRNAYEEAKATAAHWHAAAEDRSRDIDALASQLEATRASRAYRVGLALRRVARLGRR